jgi:hypothetical protein
MKTVFLLQKGAAVFGVYTSKSLAVEAQAEWCNEFMRRFDREPKFHEIPVIDEVLINGIPAKSQVEMEGGELIMNKIYVLMADDGLGYRSPVCAAGTSAQITRAMESSEVTSRKNSYTFYVVEFNDCEVDFNLCFGPDA